MLYILDKFKTLFATVKLQVLHYTQVPETLVSSGMPPPNPKKILHALNSVCQTVYMGMLNCLSCPSLALLACS